MTVPYWIIDVEGDPEVKDDDQPGSVSLYQYALVYSCIEYWSWLHWKPIEYIYFFHR